MQRSLGFIIIYKFNDQMSQLFSTLWDLDTNRCEPGSDYKLDIQGYVTSTNLSYKDRASRNLFAMFDESKIFTRPTYKAFHLLLDNYEAETDKAEVSTPEEEREIQNFLDLILATPVMKEAHAYLASNKKALSDVREFKKLLYNIWFKLYKRLYEDSAFNSCGFEHVFVGEKRGADVTGFHNWVQFYLQEKKGFIDYRGYFRRGTTEEFESSPRLMTLQFTWKKTSGKPIGSSFIGTSPEFEMAIYTIAFLMQYEKLQVRIKNYEVEINVHRHGYGIGSAFPYSLAD